MARGLLLLFQLHLKQGIEVEDVMQSYRDTGIILVFKAQVQSATFDPAIKIPISLATYVVYV